MLQQRNTHVSLIYHVFIQIKLLSVSSSMLGHKRQLCFIAPSKGAAVLVEHEASAELDNVDVDYMEGAKNLRAAPSQSCHPCQQRA